MVSHPGYGAVPPTATYSNVTITSTGATTAPIYTTGTGIGYNPVEATWSAGTNTGTMYAKDLVLDGVNLKQLLEERLNMMVPSPELEKEWHELKKLGDAYRKLEGDLKEKAKMWKALNKV
jgi:hypothetical protein